MECLRALFVLTVAAAVPLLACTADTRPNEGVIVGAVVVPDGIAQPVLIKYWGREIGRAADSVDGRFEYRLHGFPPGDRRITVSASGFRDVNVVVRVDAGTTTIPPIELEPDRGACLRAEYERTVLPPGDAETARIYGSVLTDEGSPIAGALVSALSNAGGPATSAAADVNGRFTIPGLAPGRYVISVEHPGFARVRLNDVLLDVGFEYNFGGIRLARCSPKGCYRDIRVFQSLCPVVRSEMRRLLASRGIQIDIDGEGCLAVSSPRVVAASGRNPLTAPGVIRRYSTDRPAWYILYGRVGMGGFVRFSPEVEGCEVHLGFGYSNYSAFIVPFDGDSMSFQSNLRLENEYLDELARRLGERP